MLKIIKVCLFGCFLLAQFGVIAALDVSKTIDTTTVTTQEQNITSDTPKLSIENDTKEQDIVFNVDENNITIKLSTLGVGIDYIYAVNDSSNLRFNANAWSRDTTLNDTDVTYTAEINLQSFGVIYDYHPLSSVLKLSVGAFYNGSSFDIKAKPTSDVYFTFNNNNYSVQDAGDIAGSVELKSFSPYIGFGGGSSPHGGGLFGTGLAFAFDIGALYTQYEAKLASNNCTIPTILSINGCANLVSDVEIERVKLQDNLNDLKWYSVISFGLSYKF